MEVQSFGVKLMFITCLHREPWPKPWNREPSYSETLFYGVLWVFYPASLTPLMPDHFPIVVF